MQHTAPRSTRQASTSRRVETCRDPTQTTHSSTKGLRRKVFSVRLLVAVRPEEAAVQVPLSHTTPHHIPSDQNTSRHVMPPHLDSLVDNGSRYETLHVDPPGVALGVAGRQDEGSRYFRPAPPRAAMRFSGSLNTAICLHEQHAGRSVAEEPTAAQPSPQNPPPQASRGHAPVSQWAEHLLHCFLADELPPLGVAEVWFSQGQRPDLKPPFC